MIQKKLVFIVVVFGLLVSGGFSAGSGGGQWKFYGCCTLEAYRECRGPKYFPDKASCLRYAGQGLAECRAAAAEYKSKSSSVSGGCTFVGESEEETKCLNSCASFYVCSWENGMCIKRIRGDDSFNQSFNFGATTTIKKTTTTLHRTTTTIHKTTTTTYAATATTSASTATTAKTSSTTLKDHNLEQLESHYDDESEYCGPENHPWVMKIIPRGPPGSGIDFNADCYNHDECYSNCGSTHNSKESCDQQFREGLKDKCNAGLQPTDDCSGYGWYNPFRYACLTAASMRSVYCYGSAEIYYQAVSKLANYFDAYPCNEGN